MATLGKTTLGSSYEWVLGSWVRKVVVTGPIHVSKLWWGLARYVSITPSYAAAAVYGPSATLTGTTPLAFSALEYVTLPDAAMDWYSFAVDNVLEAGTYWMFVSPDGAISDYPFDVSVETSGGESASGTSAGKDERGWPNPWNQYGYDTPTTAADDLSAYLEYDAIVRSIPVCRLDPLPSPIYTQPLTRWTYSNLDGSPQMGYELWLATDVAFTSIVLDTGLSQTDTSTAYQHSGLTPGLYYRRLQVQSREGYLSEYAEDSFTFAVPTFPTSITEDYGLFRRHADGVLSPLLVPVTGLTAKRRLDGPSEMTLSMNEFAPFIEKYLVMCQHFDEMAPSAFAHDIVQSNHLALSSDSAWVGGGGVGLDLSLAYGYSGSLNWTLDADFTVYLAVYPSGTSGCIWYLGSYADLTNYYSIQYNGAGKARIVVDGATSSNLTVSAIAYVVLRLKRSGSTLTLTRLDTGAAVTLATPHPTGNPRIVIGAFGDFTSRTSAGAILGHLLHSDVLTTAEDAQQYEAYRRFNAWKGLVL